MKNDTISWLFHSLRVHVCECVRTGVLLHVCNKRFFELTMKQTRPAAARLSQGYEREATAPSFPP